MRRFGLEYSRAIACRWRDAVRRPALPWWSWSWPGRRTRWGPRRGAVRGM